MTNIVIALESHNSILRIISVHGVTVKTDQMTSDEIGVIA